jgi:integrase
VFKNETSGEYEHDFRVDGLPRYRACYGSKKTDAERLHAVATAVFKARDPALVHALKRRGAAGVTLEQYAQLRERGRPFADALVSVAVVMPWPEIGTAVERYVSAFASNTNRAERSAHTVATQLQRWLSFQDPSTPLDAVTTTDVLDFQKAMQAEGYATNTTTSTVWRVGSLYHWHIRRERIEAREQQRQPRALYVPIDPETVTKAVTRRERYLSPPEAERLLAATPRALLFPVAAGLFGGFRLNEMLHLRPGFDVDLELGTLAVQQQPNWRPKTDRSIRRVPISSALRPILDWHLEHRAGDDWLLPSPVYSDAPMGDDAFARHFTRIVGNAGLIAGHGDPMGVTYHTLRHTFASWLLMAGADMYTVAKLLGNSVKQVEDTYGHLSKDHRQAAVDKIAGLLNAENFATSSATLEPAK